MSCLSLLMSCRKKQVILMFPMWKKILSHDFTPLELKELLKAISLSKPTIRQGLVLVERRVQHKNSKMFTQRFYVRPDQVKDTDRVVSGHHNLVGSHPQKPANVRSFGDARLVPDTIKQQTTDFFGLFASATAFYAHLRNFGIHWKNSDKPGITLMRAKIALNNAQLNGLDLKDIMPSAPTTAPATTPATTISDLADEFIQSFPEPREFCRAMESMKIPYHRSFNHQKNLEEARQSLISNMENGINIPALWNMDTRQLYDSIPSPPKTPPLPAQNQTSSITKSFNTVNEVNDFFLGGQSFSSYTDNSPYGRWVSSAPSILVRDMDDKIDKLLVKLEQKIVNIYTRHSRDFNHWLRGNFAPKTWGYGSFNNIPQIIHFFRRAKFMDDAISRFEVPQPITVHRHIPCTPELLQKIINSPNGEFSDDSYMSTSCLSTMEPKLAKKFQDTLKWNETAVHLEVDVPQGKGWGMYVAHESAYPEQCEFLLARGSRLKIESITKQPDGSYYVKCKLVGNTQKDVTKLKYRQFIKKSLSTLDAQMLKAELLEKLDEDPWERFVVPLKFDPEPNPEPPARQVQWK